MEATMEVIMEVTIKKATTKEIAMVDPSQMIQMLTENSLTFKKEICRYLYQQNINRGVITKKKLGEAKPMVGHNLPP